MTDEILLDGVRYISAKNAAEIVGLSRDYISRLCKKGEVAGRLFGKTWYVDESSLKEFVLKREFEKSDRYEELSKIRLNEYRMSNPAPRRYSDEKRERVLDTAQRVSHPTRSAAQADFDVKKALLHSMHRHVLKATSASGAARHTPLYTVTPMLDLMHKAIALVTAFMLTFGTYALVDPSYAQAAYASARNALERAANFDATGALERVAAVSVAAAEDPRSLFAAATFSIGQPTIFEKMAMRINRTIDDAIFSLAFPDLSTEIAVFDIGTRGTVTVSLEPFMERTLAQTESVHTASLPAENFPNQSAPVERIIEIQTLASTGVSEALLASRLAELERNINSRIWSHASANSTQVYQTYVAAGQLGRIEDLDDVRLDNPSVYGGSFSGLSSLSVSGNASLASTTVAGNLVVTSGGSSVSPFVVKNNSGTTVFSIANDGTLTTSVSSSTSSYSELLITGSATATTIYASNLIVSNTASTTNMLATNSTTTNLVATSATATNFFATYASTTNATSTNLYAAAATFVSGVIESLSAAAATITDLVATNLRATNATTTSATTTNLAVFTAPIAPSFVATSSAASVFPYASTTAISGTTAQFTTASSTNLVVSGAATLSALPASSILYTNASREVSAAAVNTSLIFSSGTLSLNTGNANTWTALQQFQGGASTTLLSAYSGAYFGATATSSFSSAGALTLATALGQGSGGTGFSSYTTGDILYADNIGNLSKLPIGSTGQVLKVQAGLPAWGVDLNTGGGGGSSFNMWATTTLNLIYPIDTAYPVAIGTNATSTANSIFEVSGQQYISSKLGIATTSPVTALSVGGNAYLTGGLGVGVFNGSAGTLETSGAATVGGALTVSSLTADSLLYANGSKQVSSATLSPSLTLSSGTLSLNTGNANTWTALQLFSAGASTTNLSSFGTSYFGGTATTTINSTGAITTPANFTLSGSSANIVLGSNYLSGDGGDEGVYVGSTGNVGIGTTSPSTTFGLVGSQYLTGGLGIGVLNTTAGTLQTSGAVTFADTLRVSTSTTFIATAASPALLDVRSAATSTFAGMRIHNDGVGTSASTLQFDFGSGNSQAQPVFLTASRVNSSNSNFTISTLVSGVQTNVFSTNGSSVTLPGAFTATGGLATFGNASTTQIGSTGNAYFATTGGNVGIGTTTPDKLFSVNGSAQLNVTAADTRALFLRNLTQPYTYAFKVDTNKFKITDETAGAERFTLDSSGNVGIGTYSPSAKLQVVETTNGANPFRVVSPRGTNTFTTIDEWGTLTQSYNGQNFAQLTWEGTNEGVLKLFDNGTERIHLDSDGNSWINSTTGNVGIGTTDPSLSKLQITSTSVGAETVPLVLENKNSTAATAVRFIMGASGDISANQNGRIDWLGTRQSDGSMDLNMLLSPGGGATATSRLYVDGSSGNVGIGTTGPGSKLHVAGSNSVDTPVGDLVLSRYWASSADTRASSLFHYRDSVGAMDYLMFGVTDLASEGAPNTLANVKMVIGGSGNVGIGTTSPYAKLSVVGEIVGAYFTATTSTASSLPYASSTAITVSGTGYFGTASTTNLTVSSIPSALLVTDSSGAASAYAGTSCTNQFVRSLNGAGVATCASIQDEDLNLSDITLADFTNDADFVKWANATSSLWRSTGLLSTASSTIGSGSQAGGLTISGGATTTGFLVVQGSATSTFAAGLETTYLNLTGTSATSTFANGIKLTSGCLLLPSGQCAGAGGGSGTPGGSDTQVQFNDGGSFGGDAGFTYNKTTDALTVSGNVNANGGFDVDDAFVIADGGATLTIADNFWAGLGASAGRFEFDDQTVDEFNILSANVGVGTSTPYARLSVWGEGTGSGQIFELTNNASTTIAKFLDDGTGYFLGNIGIGTTSPYRKLSLTDAVSTAQVSIAYDATRYTELLTNSVGDLVVNPQGDDAFMNDDNFWVCTGGSCPSNNPTGTGNLVVENKTGIGTTTPDSKLVIETQDATTDFLRIASSTAQSLLIFDERGFFGLGTSTPTKQLSISQNLFVGNGAPTTLGSATSTIQGDLLITGKLDVSTIDPVYTIDGVKYATYGHSTIGIKEEVVAVVELSQKTWMLGKYVYTIDFDELEEGSDLWLFYQVTRFGENWERLAITTTAGFEGSVSYKKNPGDNALSIFASQPGEISVRLIADRFDAEEWPNVRPDQGEGHPGFELSAKKENR